jgi:hypothetical protein
MPLLKMASGMADRSESDRPTRNGWDDTQQMGRSGKAFLALSHSLTETHERFSALARLIQRGLDEKRTTIKDFGPRPYVKSV